MILLRMPCVLALLVPVPQADVASLFPPVEVRQDAETDFAVFRTFSWTTPPSSGTAADTSVVWYAEKELQARGLEKVPQGPADLKVSAMLRPPKFGKASYDVSKAILGVLLAGALGSAAGDSSIQPEAPLGAELLHRRWGEAADGTLLVEISRYVDDVPVWQAATVIHSPDEKRLDAAIDKAVALLFSRFPPLDPAAPPPPATRP